MLTNIAVKDFQSIRAASLAVGNITCIVGPSDSGKSALIRAIEAIVDARRGHDFVTFGKVFSKVGLKFDDGAVVWSKGPKIAEYVLYKDGIITQTITKYSHSTPVEAADIMRLGSLTVDKDIYFNPSFSLQFDKLFLIAEKGSVAAKTLALVTSANKLLLCVKECSGRLVRVNNELSATIQVVDTNTAQLQSLASTAKLIEVNKDVQLRLSKLEYDMARLVKIHFYADALDALSWTYTKVDAEAKRLQELWLHVCNLEVLYSKYRKVTSLKEKHAAITNIAEALRILANIIEGKSIAGGINLDTLGRRIVKLNKCRDIAARYSQSADKLPRIDADIFRLSFARSQPLNGIETNVQKLNIAKALLGRIGSAQANFGFINKSVSELTDKEVQLNKELAKFSSCPLCERPYEHSNQLVA